MQIPALVEGVHQRVRHVVEVHLPRVMDQLAILPPLCVRRGRTMGRDRHDVGRTIRQMHAGLREGHLHHVFREVAGFMAHVLPGSRDAAKGGVIVRAEVGAGYAATAGIDRRAERRRPIRRQDRLRRFNHQLQLQHTGRAQREPPFNASHARATAETWAGVISFGTVMTKFEGGSRCRDARASVVTKRSSVRRLRACSSRDIGLIRMPMNGGSVPAARPLRDFFRRSLRVAIFLGVGPVAVAVLEIDPEVFDRLTSKLLHNTCPNRTASSAGWRPRAARRSRRLAHTRRARGAQRRRAFVSCPSGRDARRRKRCGPAGDRRFLLEMQWRPRHSPFSAD